LFVYVLDTTNEEFNGCIKSIVNKECEKIVENTKVLNGKIELTLEANETNMKSITENLQECDINNTNCKLSQNKETNNYQNNNTNINCDIVCTNGNLTKIMHNKENLSTSCISNYDNSNNSSEKCEAEVYQFYQNLKSQLSKFNYFLNEPTLVKHVAHLEIEASKKKELENMVTEFENKRINSPNPFSFLAELKTFIHNYESVWQLKIK